MSLPHHNRYMSHTHIICSTSHCVHAYVIVLLIHVHVHVYLMQYNIYINDGEEVIGKKRKATLESLRSEVDLPISQSHSGE